MKERDNFEKELFLSLIKDEEAELKSKEDLFVNNKQVLMEKKTYKCNREIDLDQLN